MPNNGFVSNTERRAGGVLQLIDPLTPEQVALKARRLQAAFVSGLGDEAMSNFAKALLERATDGDLPAGKLLLQVLGLAAPAASPSVVMNLNTPSPPSRSIEVLIAGEPAHHARLMISAARLIAGRGDMSAAALSAELEASEAEVLALLDAEWFVPTRSGTYALTARGRAESGVANTPSKPAGRSAGTSTNGQAE